MIRTKFLIRTSNFYYVPTNGSNFDHLPPLNHVLQPFFLALPRQVLGSSPMPNCLQLVRDLADEKLGPGPLGPWRNLQLMVKMEESLRKEKGGARRAVKEKMGFVMAGFLGNFGELWIDI